MKILDTLFQAIKSTDRYVAWKSGRTEINTKCPYCADAPRFRNKGRLFIGSKQGVPVYYCQHCGASGLVNKQFLDRLNIRDVNIITSINGILKDSYSYRIVNKTVSKINISYDYMNRAKFLLQHSGYIEKLSYLSSRLVEGDKLEPEDLNTYRVVLSLYDFVQHNPDIGKVLEKRKDIPWKIIEDKYIGFISRSGNKIIFRNIDSSSKNRYYNLTILPELELNDFYILHTDLVINKPIKIIMAEGVFDILNISRLYKDENTIFAAVLNKDYKNKIIDLIKDIGLFLDISVIIYGDRDVPAKFYKNLYSTIKDIVNEFTVYINLAAKDFGNSSDGLNLSLLYTNTNKQFIKIN